MKCRDVQKLLYTTKPDELDPAQRSALETHIVDCRDCKAVHDAVMKADLALEKLKAAVPRLRDERAVADAVVSTILRDNRERDRTAGRLIDRLAYLFSLRPVRFVCSTFIFFCLAGYISIEIVDMEQIVMLERKLGSEAALDQADLPFVRDRALHRLYDIYNLAADKQSIAEITDELVLIKRKDLQMLLDESDFLHRLPQNQLEKLSRDFQSKEGRSIDTSTLLHDLDALKKEIDRLRSQSDQERGKP